MEKFKKIGFLLLILFFAFRMWQTTGCQKFAGFYFNPLAIKISVESQTSIDQGINRNVSRFFHNKLTAGISEFGKSYVSAYEPRFLFEILGPLGLILTIAALYQLGNKRKPLLIINLGIVLLASLLIQLPGDPKRYFRVVALSWFSLSLWGLPYFFKTKAAIIIFLLLLILSFYFASLDWQMPSICHEIFFH